jgi:hypothetical protein
MFAREAEMTPIVAKWMRAQGLLVKENVAIHHLVDLVGVELDPNMVARRLRRQKPWRPLHKRIVAVELKLRRIVESLHQAYNNLSGVDESYVAFPDDVAARILANHGRWAAYWDHGIGLLSVNEGCAVLIPALPNDRQRDWMVERQVEKFWRERRKLAKGGDR